MSSVTPKLDAFAKFCSEQDPVQQIHHSSGWSHCAVGAFSPTFKAQFSDMWPTSPLYIALAMEREILDISEGLGEEFMNILGNAFNHDELATYGGLTKWLLQFQHRVIEAAQ